MLRLLPIVLALTAAAADTPWTPLAQPSAAWIAKHQALVDRLSTAGTGCRVLFLGDSITAGWTTSGAAAWETTFAPRQALPAAIPGAGTGHLLWQLDHGLLDGLDPQVVVLLIGTNNLSWPADKVALGIQTAVQAVRRRLPRAQVVLLGILPRDAREDDPRNQKRIAVNAIIGPWAQGIERVRYVDAADRFPRLETDGIAGIRPEPYTDRVDWIHLNEVGYRALAAALVPVVDELLAGTAQTHP